MTFTTTKRFTLDEYQRLADLGFLHEDERVELIRGEILHMAAKGTAHAACCRNLLEELVILVASRAKIQCQDPIFIKPNSVPEPDFTVLKKRDDNYSFAHPGPSDILLVIEIADSSLTYDQETKLSLYAEAGISDYWIFNLIENHLEAYSEPYQELNGSFGYSVKRIFLPNRAIALPTFTDLLLELPKIFPDWQS